MAYWSRHLELLTIHPKIDNVYTPTHFNSKPQKSRLGVFLIKNINTQILDFRFILTKCDDCVCQKLSHEIHHYKSFGVKNNILRKFSVYYDVIITYDENANSYLKNSKQSNHKCLMAKNVVTLQLEIHLAKLLLQKKSNRSKVHFLVCKIVFESTESVC